MTERRTLLHVFSTFNVGGPQIRFAQLANHFGLRYRHRIVAMDGATTAMQRLNFRLDAALVTVPTRKGHLLHNIRSFRRVLNGLRPDLLVTSNWGSIEWVIANFDHRFPHLHMEDGFGPDEADRPLTRRVWARRLLLSRSLVIFPTPALMSFAKSVWKLPAHACAYVPNGVDCARFALGPDAAIAAEFGIARDIPVIGTIGALRAEKNIFRLLDAFAFVLKTRQAQLVIVGEGALMQDLRRAAHHRGLSRYVVFTGESSVPERLLSLFTIFALTSDTEQMPLSVLEAMAAARPIVATDVGDVRNMVTEENRSFIVPRDSSRVGQAMLSLLDNPNEAEAIGRANRVRALALYDQTHMFAAYQRLFDGDLTRPVAVIKDHGQPQRVADG